MVVLFGLVAGACVTVGSDGAGPADADEAPTAGVAAAADTGVASPSPSAAAGSPSPVVASAVPSLPPATLAPTPAAPRIGYIALDERQAYSQAVSAGMRDAAAAAGVELIECDAGWKRTGVRACARKLANAGVAGIVSMQPFRDLAAEVCETTGDVPTVGIVYEQGPCQVSLLQVDQAESGRLAGSALGALAAERWDCDVKAYVALESGADDPIGGARMQGYREGFREHCPMPRKKERLKDAQHLITAQTQMTSVLDQVSGGKVIVAGVSDSAALGALRAAKSAGRVKHVWVAGQLAEPAARAAIACDAHFVASVARFPERFGRSAVPTLVAAMAGAEVPARLDADLELVTAENVRELFPDTPACDG